MGAYRGAGRPEATALLERLVDHAALELGIDPIELRERNLLADDVFPFATLTGNTYDSGAYRLPLRTAAEAIGYDELRAEQAARRANGGSKLLGIGVASYVEITAGGGGGEWGAVEIHDDGSATVYAGTSAHGQGHQTAFAMLVSAQTGIPIDRITLVDGDTDRVPQGGGTGGSRSLQLGGSAVHKATEAVVDKAKALAAQAARGRRRRHRRRRHARARSGSPACPPRRCGGTSWRRRHPTSDESPFGALGADVYFDQGAPTFPFGAHIAVVEVDAETGEVRLVRHVAVDDCGTVLNPLLVEGQQHGGIASGVGQALYEEVRFDTDGNPITSNFADYGVPSAAELPIVRRPCRRRRRRRSTRSAPRGSVRRRRSGRRRRSRTPSSTPSPTSASATSTCRARPSGCGARCATPGPARSPTRGASRRRCSPDRPPPTRPDEADIDAAEGI